MESANAQQPNILWICTDQQRFDTIAKLGNKHIRTTHIDRLAEQGVAFRRAYTQSPICTPSRACFLTGRYPKTTRARQNGNAYFPPDEVLVTKLLADGGYECGLVGKLHLSTAQGEKEARTDDGYSTFKWSQHPHDDWAEGHDYQLWLKAKGIEWSEHYHLGDWKNLFGPGEGGIAPEYHQTTWCATEAIDFIAKSRNTLWLLSINMFDPHPPFDSPAAYREKYPTEAMPLPKWRSGELDNKPAIQKYDYENGGQGGSGPCFLTMDDHEKRQAIADYYAMIELIDD
jgi:arylsulfatase